MTEIPALLVKELRKKTGSGMMDCKKALVASGADFEKAVDWLRKNGLSVATRKVGRVTTDGLVAVSSDGKNGALVEINAETDFVARNEQFQGFVKLISDLVLKVGDDMATLKTAVTTGGKTIDEELTTMIATLGENINFRRAKCLSVSQGVVANYMHNAIAPGLGKIGVLVSLESSGNVVKLTEIGKQIAMHVAASNPLFLSIKSIDDVALNRERTIIAEQVAKSGKPPNVIEKMIEGRIRKYYEEVVLLEQIFVVDGSTKISKVIENTSEILGAPIKLSGFVRYVLGDGIEKEHKDFATEVAAQLVR
ncbi:MAG: translation elongation factor Ts [Rhodospirillaceae bacterium]|jgi:elongation factor Ts|nr:translation elongation factor Ts [Rhodospirillaceae bacterium]